MLRVRTAMSFVAPHGIAHGWCDTDNGLFCARCTRYRHACKVPALFHQVTVEAFSLS